MFSKKILDRVGLVVAVGATVVVMTLIVSLSLNQTPGREVSSSKFVWCKTDVVDTEQLYGPVLDGDPVTYWDAGFYSGEDAVYLGQMVSRDVVTIIDTKEQWLHCDNKSKSIQMELYDSGSGLYVQALRTCSAYVSTIRGVYVGMPISQAMAMFPGYADTVKIKDEIQIVADDTTILFKLDNRDCIKEISMRFNKEG